MGVIKKERQEERVIMRLHVTANSNQFCSRIESLCTNIEFMALERL